MALFGAPPNTGFGLDQTVEHDGEFTMPPPIDLVQAKNDADVEASAFQASIDNIVSRYEEIMTISHDPEVDKDADPKQELARLRFLHKACEEGIRELDALVKDLRRTHTAYHHLVSALPNEGRLRLDFTAEFNRVMKENNYTESIKGAKKRIDELKAMLKEVVTNHDQLKRSLPEHHVSFDIESESEYTGEDEPSPKASYEATSSRRTSKVPSGATGPKQPIPETRTKGPQKPPSHTRSYEQPRQTGKNSAEFGDSSTDATNGSSEPPAANSGSRANGSDSLWNAFRRTSQKTSNSERSRSPLRFNADGKPRTTSDDKKRYDDAVKSGADFSAYNGNPFYQNSSVKLPILPSECVPSGTDKYPAPPPLVFKGITDAPFTGDIRLYPRWRDAFIRLVHAPGRVMQDADRLLYLKQCLKGLPLDLADRYSIDDVGYQYATAALEKRFYNPQQARFALRKDLQDLRAPASTYADILRFEQDLVHICGNFRQAGEDITANSWCFDLVMAKLPQSVRYALIQRKRDKGDTSPWTIQLLLDEIHDALDIMNEVSTYDGATPQQPYGSKAQKSRILALEGPYTSSSERHGGTFVGAVSDGPKTRACAFCGTKGKHWATDCPYYPTVSERYERAKELNFCFVCLCKDHWRTDAKACKVQGGLCPFCEKAFHHKALCTTFLEKRRAGGGQQQSTKKSTNRNQRGAGSTKNPKNGRLPYRAQHDGRSPVAPGGAAYHRTDHGHLVPPRTSSSHQGRAQTHAAAAYGTEDASATRMTKPPESKEDGAAGTPIAPQQPSGSKVADSYEFETAHMRHTNGEKASHTHDDGQYSVVSHDSDAPTEPDEDQLPPFDPASFYSGYAAVGVHYASEKRTHGTLLECGMATVFNPATKRRKRVSFMFDSGSSGTFVSQEVAHELGLPNFGDQRLRMDTFAQDKPTRLDTFHTHLGFDQLDGSSLVLNVKASQKLVPTLEAVFIKPSDETLLRRNRFELVPQHVTSDILIGVHEQHIFRKETVYPPLPSGFCLVRSIIGTILAGSGRLKTRSSDLTCTAKESSDSSNPPCSSLSSSELTNSAKESSDSTSPLSSSLSSSEQTATAGQIGSHTSAPEATAKTATASKAVRFFEETTAGIFDTIDDTSPPDIFKNARITHGSDAAAATDHVSYETHGHGSSDPPDENSNIGVPAESERLSVFFAHPTEEESLHEMAQNFWRTENIGIEKNDPRKEDDLVHERIKKKIRICEEDGGRYQVRLPWKTENGEPPSNQELPTHMGLARGRLASLQRAHTPEFLLQYGAGF
ncbi:Zinc knuckle family protein [Aphelenchoides avenae]|nr:Zinc knuckle family protein [Aphelenchus avenae]